jgi:hypothetical protein
LDNRPLLCELKDGVVGKVDVGFLVNEGIPFLEYINDAIGHIVEGRIFMKLKKLFFEKQKTDSGFDSYALDDTSFAYSIRQMQTAFYLLLLRYALALFL